MEGEWFEGACTTTVKLASGKYAWRPSFEDIKGKAMSGTVTGQGVSTRASGDWAFDKRLIDNIDCMNTPR
jgi:hypothetical protein